MSELVDGAKSAADQIEGDVEDTLTGVVQSLREASANALELSEDATVALSNAAAELLRVAEMLRKNSVEAVRDMTRNAAHEVQAHPIASIAAALTAVGGLVGVIVASRSRKSKAAAPAD